MTPLSRRAARTERRAGPASGPHSQPPALPRILCPDVAISTAVSPAAVEQAYGSLARGGTLVFVGLPADNVVQLPVFETVLGGLTITGSIVGTHHDLEEVFQLHQLGRTKVLYETRELEQVNESFREVLDGTAKARGWSSSSREATRAWRASAPRAPLNRMPAPTPRRPSGSCCAT